MARLVEVTDEPKAKGYRLVPVEEKGIINDGVAQGLGNLAGGLVRGAGSIGATIIAPYDIAKDAINGKGLSLESNRLRRKEMDDGLQMMGSDPESGLYATGKIGTEILGTSGVGNALASAKLLSNAPKLANAIRSSGFSLGSDAVQGLSKGQVAIQALTRGGTRAAGAGITGGISSAMIEPDTALTGAAISAAIPVGASSAGKLSQVIGKSIVGDVSPEVASLYKKAVDLGVDVPIDRVANSKPLNAIAASLNYVPFSGRAAVESTMENQLNTALSKTFGQNSPNVTMALRNAKGDLGGKFDDVLKNNGVNFDKQFLSDITTTQNESAGTLVGDQLLKINKQVDNIISKTKNGTIDGEAAYNIKKQLDTLSNSSDSEVAKYSRDLRDNLMDALNRSLGKDKAADFATTRKQWGNMRSLERLANNGADGGISVARLANMKNIGNADLQDLADVAAQFVKQRESQHGAAQRIFGAGGLLGAGLLGGGLAGAGTGLALGAGIGRATNSMLQSKSLINRAVGNTPNTQSLLERYGLLGLPAAINAQ